MSRNEKSSWGVSPGKDASMARLDPVLGLGAAVVATAVRDLFEPDPVTSLDALIWLLWGDGPLWLEALLGQELAEEKILQLAVTGGIRHVKNG